MTAAQMVSANTLNPADVVADDDSGSLGIPEQLQAFADELKKKYPKDDPSLLARPFVLESTWPIVSADIGISDHMVWQPDDGVMVVIPLSKNMGESDLVSVWWNGSIVVNERITRAQLQQGNAYIAFNVPSKKVPIGKGRLSYEVYGGKLQGTSAPLTTLVRFGQPGHTGTGAPVELPAPLVAKPASGLIDAAQAKAKVKVTIPAYVNMREHDRIHLYWGDEVYEHTVQQGEVGQAIVIEVTEDIIRAAGDSDALPVYYFVADEVGNESEWSADTFLHVDLNGNGLKAPEILDPANASQNGAVSVINVDNISVADLQIKVETVGNFQLGDRVRLQWSGTTVGGQTSTLDLGPEEVKVLGKPLLFTVANSEVTSLAGGAGKASYVIERGTLKLTSKDSYVSFTGTPPSGLPAPIVDDADDDWIEADRKTVHVIIPQEAGLKAGDEVTVTWRGTCADGSALLKKTKTYRVTSTHQGKPLPRRFSGAAVVKPVDGGFVDIFYSVKRGTASRDSDRIQIFVGDLQETLAAPTTDPGLANAVLNPTDDDFRMGVDIEVPTPSSLQPPYKVTVVWSTSAGGYFEDEQDVGANDQPSPFLIPADELELKGNQPVEVTVYYIISQDGKPDHASADLEFKIAEPNMLIAPLTVNQGVMKIDGGALEVFQQRGNAFAPAGWSISAKYQVPSQQRLPQDGLPPFTYQSGNTNVATVDKNGQVSFVRNGSTTITITDARQDKASYRVEVVGCFNVYLADGNHNLNTALAWCNQHGLRASSTKEQLSLMDKFGNPAPISRHSWTCIRLNYDAGWFYHATQRSWGYYANTTNGGVLGAMAVKSV
ncbi:Ig-like domain-containing protein [Pseudomonas fluorescens]|uniref:Ig-like domain-containing protein n=1 Tax=Pseudomonas fluorescens TaxID=294 RepID=UPI0017871508|nr:Ig-like domain-containing protein [Pseudomonas fluorescens]